MSAFSLLAALWFCSTWIRFLFRYFWYEASSDENARQAVSKLHLFSGRGAVIHFFISLYLDKLALGTDRKTEDTSHLPTPQTWNKEVKPLETNIIKIRLKYSTLWIVYNELKQILLYLTEWIVINMHIDMSKRKVYNNIVPWWNMQE